MAEGEKRKTEENDGVSAARKRARAKQPPLEVADEEVEEFFAILKRIRAAVKYFGTGDGESGIRRKMTTVLLERECSAEVNGGVAAVEEKTQTAIKNIGVIDLNMVPNPDDNTS